MVSYISFHFPYAGQWCQSPHWFHYRSCELESAVLRHHRGRSLGSKTHCRKDYACYRHHNFSSRWASRSGAYQAEKRFPLRAHEERLFESWYFFLYLFWTWGSWYVFNSQTLNGFLWLTIRLQLHIFYPLVKVEITKGVSATLWDRWEVKKAYTLGDVMNYFNRKYGFTVTAVAQQDSGTMIYMPLPKHKDKPKEAMRNLLKRKRGKKYADLVIGFSDAKGAPVTNVPTIRYYFRRRKADKASSSGSSSRM